MYICNVFGTIVLVIFGLNIFVFVLIIFVRVWNICVQSDSFVRMKCTDKCFGECCGFWIFLLGWNLFVSSYIILCEDLLFVTKNCCLIFGLYK